jgi:hypothetical protein
MDRLATEAALMARDQPATSPTRCKRPGEVELIGGEEK